MSRRNEITMTPDEVSAYLNIQLTIVIISNGRNGYPHPMPMNYSLDGDGLIAMTTYKKSQKVFNFRRDPRASLLLESGESYEELRSVMIYAQTEIIDDHAATLACMQACRKHANDVCGVVKTAEEDAEFLETATRRAEKRLVLKFIPDEIISWDHSKLGGRY